MRYLFLFMILICSAFTVLAQSQPGEAWVAEADSLAQQEAFDKALPLYDKALTKGELGNDDYYNTLYKRALCYFRLDHFQEALTDIKAFIEEYPSIPEALMLRTFIYQGLEDDEQQLASLSELVELEPFNTELLTWRGYLLIQADEYEEAVKTLKKSSQLHATAETSTYLGLAYYNLDNADSAILHFDKAISLDDTYSPAYFYASAVCLDEEAYPLALTYINEGLILNPVDLNLLFYKGIALVETDQKKAGCRCLSKAFYSGNDQASGYLEEYCYK